MSVTVLNPQVHWIKDTPCAQFFRRKLRDPDIVTFWHAETGQWILAYLLRRGIVEEIEDLGVDFELVTDDFVDMIVRCYGHVDLSKKKKRLLATESARLQRQSDSILKNQEKWDWLRKRTQDKAPLPFVIHTTPTERGY